MKLIDFLKQDIEETCDVCINEKKSEIDALFKKISREVFPEYKNPKEGEIGYWELESFFNTEKNKKKLDVLFDELLFEHDMLEMFRELYSVDKLKDTKKEEKDEYLLYLRELTLRNIRIREKNELEEKNITSKRIKENLNERFFEEIFISEFDLEKLTRNSFRLGQYVKRERKIYDCMDDEKEKIKTLYSNIFYKFLLVEHFKRVRDKIYH